MESQDTTAILEAINEQLEVFTPDGGNRLAGAYIDDHQVFDDELLVGLTDGRKFALKVEAF